MLRDLLAVLILVMFFGGYYLYQKNPLNLHWITHSVQNITPSPVDLNQPFLQNLSSGSTVTSPLTLKGYVPANWVFEGQFQLFLLDSRRREILHAPVHVEADPSHQKSVLSFDQTFNFSASDKSGFLVLRNDNPSGLPQNQKSLEIPVQLSSKYTCPQKPWVNCMPGLGPRSPACAPEYLQWAKLNCPDFRGASY